MKNVKILHKRGVRAPVPDDIDVGEVAVNTASGKLYVKTDGDDVVEIGSDNGSGGTGAGMVISETEPVDKFTGMQWLEVSGDEPYIWIWDEDKWLQWPAPAPKPPVYISADEPEGAAQGDLWYDPSNGSLNLFDGSTWINIGAQGVTYTLPIVTRDGKIELPVTADGKNLSVALRGGTSAELPLSGSKLNVNTRGGPVELPLAA